MIVTIRSKIGSFAHALIRQNLFPDNRHALKSEYRCTGPDVSHMNCYYRIQLKSSDIFQKCAKNKSQSFLASITSL